MLAHGRSYHRIPPFSPGPAGFALLLVRRDLVTPTAAVKHTPSIMNLYQMSASTPIQSIYNTPPTFQLYMHGLVLDDMIAFGGLAEVEKRAVRRAADVYAEIDNSKGFYVNTVQAPWRSRMSVPFRIRGGDRALEDRFLAEAAKKGQSSGPCPQVTWLACVLRRRLV